MWVAAASDCNRVTDVTETADIETIRARAKEANVNEQTLLATDYLNHFNEALMLLELVPDMPECLDDLASWEPIGYEEHFRRSSLSGRALVINAYAHSPAEYREPFDEVIRRLGDLVQAAIACAGTMIARGNTEAADRIIGRAMPAIRELQEAAAAIINGAHVSFNRGEIVESADTTLNQAEIDQLLGR